MKREVWMGGEEENEALAYRASGAENTWNTMSLGDPSGRGLKVCLPHLFLGKSGMLKLERCG